MFLEGKLLKSRASILTLFRMGFFGAALMKIGTVILYLKKIEELYESRDAPLEFC